MTETFYVLLVEDNPGDVRLLREMLHNADFMKIQEVDRLDCAVEHLRQQRADLVLLDLGLPDCQGLDTLHRFQTLIPDIPVVVLTGYDDEEIGRRAVREGAQDYLVKGTFPESMLPRVLLFAAERHHHQEKYNRLFTYMSEGVFYQAADGAILDVNQAALDMFGLTRDEFLSKNSFDPRWRVIQEDGSPVPGDAHPSMRVLRTGCPIYNETLGIFNPQKNKTVWFRISAIPLVHVGEDLPYQVFVTLHDITNRKETEASLKESEERYRKFFEDDLTGDSITSVDGWILDCNPAFLRIFGFQTKEEALQFNLESLYVPPESRLDLLRALREKKQLRLIEKEMRRVDGKVIYTIENNSGLFDETGELVGIRSYIFDNTDRKILEEQLRQSQKLEAVGQLAGGVAHDFNNIILAIRGYSDLVLRTLALDHSARSDIQEIKRASDRAASLTKQLLAFARKQTALPEIMDLNEVVAGMLKMLQRLIGEDIELIWHLRPEIWKIKIDPTQIDQIMANLAVNARDAIAGVGTLTIELENIEVDESYCAMHVDFIPGEYVRLSVSDSGCGMDKETLQKIFEPFFTTKGIGQGTGLGLSTVYGIVKQNHGFINVYSEPEEGTSFHIYLPRFVGDEIEKPEALGLKALKEGSETILLVEDDETILNISKRFLDRLGYRVLISHAPMDAIRLVENTTETIHLLITDVVMPEMNGRDLAEKILALNPGVKCLYMSGYTADIIARHGILEKGIYFIHKPFSLEALSIKVREVLDP